MRYIFRGFEKGADSDGLVPPSLQTYTDTRRTPLLLGRRLCRRPRIFSFRIKRSGHKKGAQVQPLQLVLRTFIGSCPYAQARPRRTAAGIARVSDKIYTDENLSRFAIVASLL